MGRQLRDQLPGVPFHLTARIQGRAPVFRDAERFVAARIVAAPRRSDAALLAYAVMPNHLHLIAVQGRQPLSALMQPLLRRIALMVQRRTGDDGHVFERRFRASPCLDPDYFRNAIAYVHLNGVRAGLCASADDYAWCSHAAYCALGETALTYFEDQGIAGALRVFAARDGQTLRECVDDYRAFLQWRCAMDEFIRTEVDNVDRLPPRQPVTLAGDLHWQRDYGAASVRIPPEPVSTRPDLRDIARATVDDCAPDMDLELLRSGSRTKALVRVRRRFIVRASAAGHAGGTIARFLHISPTTVSAVRTAAMNEGR